MGALSEVAVDIVASGDEARFRDLMEAHHYLGALPGMGETVRYVAHHRGLWLALLVFSAPALKCRARDRWIGWDFGVQFNRLHLVTNNSRFLILPGDPRNLGSRVADVAGRTITADALLTQRRLADYLLGRGADYLFTVKGNQPKLHDRIRLVLDESIAQGAADFAVETARPVHGGHERRSIWTSSKLNGRLNFPGVGQVFAVRRATFEVKSGKRRIETAFGVTSLTPETATPERLLTLNRGHWTIEAAHHILDWSFDEDRSRIRTGHGPENMTRLRRFAIGLIKARSLAVAETMRNLARNPRRVLDFLKMTANACPQAAPG